MQRLTIERLNSKPFNGQYGPTNKVGIITKELGEKWLNAFIDDIEFKVGDVIFAEVTQKGEYTNFNYKGKDEATPKSTVINNQAKAKVEQKNEDEKWDKISWGKCKHAYLVEAFKLFIEKGSLNTVNLKDVEKNCEEWADMSMRDTRKLQKSQSVDEPNYPEAGGHIEEYPIEGIPF